MCLLGLAFRSSFCKTFLCLDTAALSTSHPRINVCCLGLADNLIADGQGLQGLYYFSFFDCHSFVNTLLSPAMQAPEIPVKSV